MEEQINKFLNISYGSGSGSGDGYGSKMINGDKIYIIDDTPTIIKQVRGNIAKGFILQSDLTLTPTVVVKQSNKFAHGETLHEAYSSLMEKLYDDSSDEERIEAFNKQFPNRNKKYHAKDLFHWHHVLTGSCKQGRLSFCKDKRIDIENDSYTILEFIDITKDSYGGDIIRRLLP